MKIRKRRILPPPTSHSQGGFTSSRPGRLFKDFCKNLAYALLVIGLMLAIIALGMWEIGEGKVKSGPLTVPNLSKEKIQKRIKYHGLAGLGSALRGVAWRGRARRGLARRGWARLGKANQGVFMPKICIKTGRPTQAAKGGFKWAGVQRLSFLTR